MHNHDPQEQVALGFVKMTGGVATGAVLNLVKHPAYAQFSNPPS